MIIINGQEPISKYNNFSMTEEVNGTFEVSFTSFNLDNLGHGLIEEESLISVDGYDFRVKQMKEVKNRKAVVAISTFYDLVGHRQEDIYGGTRTFNEFAIFVFSGTGWTFTSDVSGHMLIPNFGTDNVIKLVQGLCQVYECEFKIMPNNHVHFSNQIGPDNDAQYRYGHNVKALSKSVDTTNLRTKIKGYGADNLVVTYTSPNAEIFGVIEAEPISDDRFTVGENLVEHIKKGLIDYPEVSLEMDTVELTNKELGERVWLIYEPLNIEFQTRVLSKKSTMRNGELVTTSVALGNAMPKSLGDILASQKVEIDENKKQVMSRFEQVNDRITAEVEEVGSSIAGLEITVGEVKLYAEGVKEYVDDELGEVRSEASADFTVLTNAINASVTESKTYTDAEIGKVESNASSNFDILAGRISAKAESSTVTSLGNRVNRVEWDMDAIEGEISMKVDKNGVISAINLSSESATIQARNVNLVGAVNVLSSISGNLGTITAGTIRGADFVLNGGQLDLRLGTILWGSNVPGNVVYAQNAGNANMLNGQYTAADFSRNGHTHGNTYIKSRSNQDIALHRDNATGRIVVTVGGSNMGTLAWY